MCLLCLWFRITSTCTVTIIIDIWLLLKWSMVLHSGQWTVSVTFTTNLIFCPHLMCFDYNTIGLESKANCRQNCLEYNFITNLNTTFYTTLVRAAQPERWPFKRLLTSLAIDCSIKCIRSNTRIKTTSYHPFGFNWLLLSCSMILVNESRTWFLTNERWLTFRPLK